MKANPALLLAILILIPMFSGCGTQKPATDPAQDRLARKIALRARDLNTGIITSKGTGWLRVDAPDRKEQYRIAWAAEAPNRVRITFMVSGVPMETIVANGERVVFTSHTGKHAPHTAVSNDPDMERYIRVPVRLSGIVALLLGRVPVERFDAAWFSPGVKDRSRITLVRRFASGYQELALTPDRQAKSLGQRSREGSVLYRIHFQSWQNTDKYRVPQAVSLDDGRHRTVDLTFTRFLANPPLKESVFRLTPAGT